MTVTNPRRSVTHNGNGITTVFPVANDGPIYFLNATELVVTLIDTDGTETRLMLGAGYSVSGAGNPSGGSVTTVTPPAAGQKLRIERLVPLVQPTQYPENTKFPAASHERALDRLTMVDQQQQEDLSRAPKLPKGAGLGEVEIRPGETGKVLGWGSDGNIIPLINSAAEAEIVAEEVREIRKETFEDKEAAQQARSDAGDFAGAAAGSASSANTDADRAVLAAGNAFVNANVYADVATGRAAVANGEQFQVLAGDEYVRYRRDSSSTQTEVGRYPSALMVQEVANRVGASDPDEIIHAFVDEENRLLAYINQDGEMDLHPTEATRDRVSRVEKNNDEGFLFLLLDGENKVVWGVDADGNPTTGTATQANSFGPAPLKDVTTTVRVKAFDRVIEKLDLKTTAIGRSDQPTIEVNGDGLTHPKMLYIPQGWNGYKYWLAATPTFGVVNNAAYGSAHENPHVWASNDLVTWVEPSGGPLDLPEDGNGSYWSDTHLALDDDGWLYCIYRGQYFSFASGRVIVARRSRDGVNWSDRIIISNPSDGPLTAANLAASPVIFKKGSRWTYIDILNTSTSFPVPPNDYSASRAVFRRSSSLVVSGYEPYDATQIVNYKNREWGPSKEPWHIDALQVGNLHLHLVNAGGNGLSTANEIYLAWSGDGWNFDVLPRLDTGVFNAYRSSISVADVRPKEIDLDAIVARTNGTMDLYKLTLEMD